MNSSQIVGRAVETNKKFRKAKKSLVLASLNFCLLLLLAYDLYFKCPLYTTIFQYFEYVLLATVSVNLLYLILYFTLSFGWLQPQEITETQRKLLGISKQNPSFRIVSNDESKQSNKSNSFSRNETNISDASFMSYKELQSFIKSKDSNYTMSSPSWTYCNSSQELKNSYRVSDDDSMLADESSFRKYLLEYEKNEKLNQINNSNSLKNSISNQSSMSKYCISTSPSYQISNDMFCQNGNSTSNKKSKQLDVWKNHNIDDVSLAQWNENLRKWISMTILNRLLNESKKINEHFEKLGLVELKIGASSLGRLKKAYNTLSTAKQSSSLNCLLPFLEFTQNQNYLWQRFEELRKGGCLSKFSWNGGSFFNGKPWGDHLPTDSEILMHIFMTYLDSQLNALAPDVNLKPFSSVYYVNEAIEKPSSKTASIYICEKSNKPPHYSLVVNKEVIELQPGRNNLFHVILLFLHYIKTKENGMLGRLNIGKSGINMLCIIDTMES